MWCSYGFLAIDGLILYQKMWIICLARSEVYMADLESGLHYLLRVELATHKTLEGEELKIFKDFVAVVAKVVF